MSATSDRPRAGFGEALHRELAEARRRVEELARARRELEQRLRDARLAEGTARRGLEALESVAREADAADGAREPVAGAALRDRLARSALRRRPGVPAHWRDWLAWLHEDGFDAAGRNAEATFVTQLTRSPLVRRAEQEGVYVLDVALVASLRERLHQLHERLSRLPPPDQLALLDDDTRAGRQEVQLEIGRAERALREAWSVLSQEPPAWWQPGDAPTPDAVVAAWLTADVDPGQLRVSDTVT